MCKYGSRRVFQNSNSRTEKLSLAFTGEQSQVEPVHGWRSEGACGGGQADQALRAHSAVTGGGEVHTGGKPYLDIIGCLQMLMQIR